MISLLDSKIRYPSLSDPANFSGVAEDHPTTEQLQEPTYYKNLTRSDIRVGLGVVNVLSRELQRIGLSLESIVVSKEGQKHKFTNFENRV